MTKETFKQYIYKEVEKDGETYCQEIVLTPEFKKYLKDQDKLINRIKRYFKNRKMRG